MKYFKFFLISCFILFSQIVYSQPDLILGNYVPNQMFILHSRWNSGGDFFQLTADDGNNNWQWDKGITFVRSTGNVGIGTTNPSGKFTVRGGIHMQETNDANLRLSMGYFKNGSVEYSFLNSLDWGTLAGKNLVINSRTSNDAWGNVGIGPLEPIQALDIGGRLNIRKGVIQNGTIPVTSTEDLGLYSQNSNWLRIVTNNQPIRFFTDGNSSTQWRGTDNGAKLTIDPNGSVGIGVQYPGTDYRLQVNGKVLCEELRVQNVADWPDYIFKESHILMPLDKVESYIKENGHLPEIPGELEVSENGVELGSMSAKLLQKIEELTLYVIEQKKEIEQLKESNRKNNK